MGQVLDVIEWVDGAGDEIVHRIPSVGSAETKLGSQLVVRDNQVAVFFRSGRALDAFGPGRHTLLTGNLPLLTTALALPWGFTSPFRCEVYFVSTRVFTNMRWGTKDPVAFRDRELGLVRLRAFGAFTMRVTEPVVFVNALVGGTVATYGTADIEDYLRELIVSRLNDYLGETVDTLLDLPKHYDEIGTRVQARIADDFSKYGIALIDLLINRITPPEDVQRVLDERTGMAAVGDLDAYLRFKAATALGDAARNTGNVAAAGLAVGVGTGLGVMLPGMVGGARPAGTACPRCARAVAADARFCSSCGVELPTTPLVCGACKASLPPGARYCTRCGEKVAGATPDPGRQPG
jgi:membrane protease subunit (stomatin/prohibitin family)